MPASRGTSSKSPCFIRRRRRFGDFPAFLCPGRRASDCIKCGKCEKACPQHLPIRQLLEQVSQEFDKAR